MAFLNEQTAQMIRKTVTFFGLLFAAVATISAAEDRDAKVRSDRDDVQATGHWIYNDLAQGMAEATRKARPLLVVFRCVP